MDHHGGGGVAEGSRVYQVHLPPIAFFGRGAQHGDPEAQFLGEGLEGETGAHRRRGDDVVTAGMADAWKGVVLGADHQLRSLLSGPGREGGVQAVGGVLDRETVALQHLGEAG